MGSSAQKSRDHACGLGEAPHIRLRQGACMPIFPIRYSSHRRNSVASNRHTCPKCSLSQPTWTFSPSWTACHERCHRPPRARGRRRSRRRSPHHRRRPRSGGPPWSWPCCCCAPRTRPVKHRRTEPRIHTSPYSPLHAALSPQTPSVAPGRRSRNHPSIPAFSRGGLGLSFPQARLIVRHCQPPLRLLPPHNHQLTSIICPVIHPLQAPARKPPPAPSRGFPPKL
jgi:hypothetical protein